MQATKLQFFSADAPISGLKYLPLNILTKKVFTGINYYAGDWKVDEVFSLQLDNKGVFI